MDVRTLVAILEAIFSYFCFAWGLVFQKKGIEWLGYKGSKNNNYYSNFKLWLTGLSLLILGGIPNYLALKVLNVHLIDVISGLNIIFIIFLSRMILKETLFILDYIFSVTLCATAFILIDLVDRSAGLTVSAEYAYIVAIIPVSLFLFGAYFGLLDVLSAVPAFKPFLWQVWAAA